MKSLRSQGFSQSPEKFRVALFPLGFPGGSEVKSSACNTGHLGLIPGSGRSPAEGNGNPLQYSCLENPMDGGAWWATVHRVEKSQTLLSDFTLLHLFPYVCVCVCVCVLGHFSCVQLFMTPWTIVCQAPLSLRFSRQEWAARRSSRGSS